MGLDLRIPIGLLLTIIGILLSGYGLASNPAIYARSLGINVNLWWGWVLVVVGILLLAAAHRARRSTE
jgi:hypothetical protein